MRTYRITNVTFCVRNEINEIKRNFGVVINCFARNGLIVV